MKITLKRILLTALIITCFLLITAGIFYKLDFRKIIPLNVGIVPPNEVMDDSQGVINAMKPNGDGWIVENEDPYIVYESINRYLSDVDIEFDEGLGELCLVVYYDSEGDGFSEGERLAPEKIGDNTYHIDFDKNIYRIRVDIEGSRKGSQIPDMDMTLENDTSVYESSKIRFYIYNIVILLFLVLNVVYEIFYKERNWLFVGAKVVIIGILIGLSECTLFRNHGSSEIIVFLFALSSIVTMAMFECGEDGNLKYKKAFYGCLLGSCFLFYLIWAMIIPFNSGPDEHMRYQIPEFIYKYGGLPHGGDERIREPVWGISYAFTPITSYIISALFMKVTSLFTTNADALLLSARLVSVISSVGTVFFCVLISEKIFKGPFKYIFIISVAFWPQFVFISSYVNNDSFGIMTVAWIIYALMNCAEHKWDSKSCLQLGLPIGLCMISYYNCYGAVLAAVIYALLSVCTDKQIENKPRFIMNRVLCVAVVAFIICGWWFIRNAIIYNGDFIGLNTSAEYAEKYAITALKPSNRQTAYSVHMPLKEMLFERKWLRTVLFSYVACFDAMSVPIRDWCYNIVFAISLTGLCGCFLPSKLTKENNNKYNWKFWSSMLIICIITFLLCLYYSYFNDWQPQGRYCLPMIVALQLFVTRGLEKLAYRDRAIIGKCVSFVVVCIYLTVAMFSIYDILIPIYA